MSPVRNVCSFLATIFATACVSAQTTAPAAATTGNVERTRAEYNVIASHLDVGGDLMVVANTDGVVEDVVDTARGIVGQLPLGGENSALTQAMDRLPAFVKSSGLYAFQGFGMSLVPRNDGLNDFKAFLYRDPAAAQLPLWQGLIGGAPKRLATLDYLPADTVFVRACTGDPRQFWKFVRDAVQQVGGPDADKGFNNFVSGATGFLGTNLDSVIGSMDAEQFVSLQLSSTQTVQLPLTETNAGAQAISIPVPALLAGCAVHDATLVKALQNALQLKKVPVITSTSGATTLYTVNLPIQQLPFPVTPTFAVHRNMFLLGSTADIVRNAIADAEGKGGPRLPAGFQKAFAGLPRQNNGFAFCDRRLTEALQNVQNGLLKHGENDALSRLMQRYPPGQGAAVFVNEKDGISARGTTSENGRQVMLSVAMFPVAIVAGASAIAIPSFMHARNAARASAQANAAGYSSTNAANSRVTKAIICSMKLQQIDHAKQIWATANNKAETDTPAEQDLAPYLRNGNMPVCPCGGTYKINAVGEKPTCSVSGHEMPQPQTIAPAARVLP